ncbi:MAG: hypothetical protein MO846_10635 [Candidatus Devosia symbiotica]|nr:hypothetical protein [Candidatus Devosia symbiotica]
MAIPLNTVLPLHVIDASLALELSCFGFIVLANVVWREHHIFALYSLATGALALLGFALYAAENFLGGRVTVKRLAAWSHTLWYMATSLLILRSNLRLSAS